MIYISRCEVSKLTTMVANEARIVLHVKMSLVLSSMDIHITSLTCFQRGINHFYSIYAGDMMKATLANYKKL